MIEILIPFLTLIICFKGDNFIGEIYRILYKLKADNKENEQKSLILKIAAQNVTHREKFKLRYFFEREIRMYEEVCCLN